MVQDTRPGGSPSGSPFSRIPLPVIGALVVVVVVGLVLVVVALGSGGGGGDEARSTAGPGNQFDFAGLADSTSVPPTPEATLDLARATALAPNVQAVSADDRLIIDKFGVNAPLSLKTVDLSGQMPNPNSPDDVALYDYSAWPGLGGAPGRGGNSVFAGHVDSGSKPCKNGTVKPPCEAVFWDITRLKVGDIIEIKLSGQSYKYRVTSNAPVSATSGDWGTIVASTAQESITLITCAGDFNQQTHEYDSRQVVTAVRV